MIERQKMIYLCNPALEKINVLNGVKTETADYHPHVKDYDELTFEVDKYINVDGKLIISNCYDLLDVYMYLYLEGIGHFQMQMPETRNEGWNETKSIVAYSIEKEFEDKDWKGLEVNTGLDGSLERLATDNLDDLGFAKEFVTLYNPQKPELSFLHLLIKEKMPMWSVRDDDIDPLSWNKKMSISEENINCYALLTSSIAPKLDIIFMFDTMNRRIKVIDKQSLNSWKYDTNIYIGMRNLMQNESFSIDEDSVFTRFYVQGDDTLDIRDYNYDDNRMVNLDYFMDEKYMGADLIEKIQRWLQWRDDNRDTFIEYSKQLADINDKITEINYRVPHDGLNTNQYTNMDDKLLVENQKYFNAQIEALQVSVDPDQATRRDENNKYIPRTKVVDGETVVDHDWYLERLKTRNNGYGGYYTYFEIITYILPNIQIAMDNKGVVIDERTDYLEGFETTWEFFGIKELEAKATDYENRMEAITNYATPWDELTDVDKAKYLGGEGQYNVKHDEYIKLKGYLGTEDTPDTLLYVLKQLRGEVETLQAQYDEINQTYRLPMIDKAKLDNEEWGLTTKELYVVNTLFHDTDYQNNNIITTSIDTALTKIDREKELYEDAEEKLSEVSQPQMHFNISMDNFLYIPEFSIWKEDLDLLKFIRVGIHDDYAVKLRVIGYHYNPCEITDVLELEFSNFITSKSGRSDLTDIVGSENNRGAKNSISIGTGNSETDRQYMTALLQMMTQNQLFTSAVSNIAGNTVGPINEGQILNLISDVINASEINVGNITGEKGEFQKLLAGYIDSDFITTELLNADKAKINDILRIGTDAITEITGDYISTATIRADQVDVTNAFVERVITIGTNSITRIAEGTITTENVIASLVSADKGDFDELTADSAFIEHLNSGIIDAGTVSADTIIAGLADVTKEQIDKFNILAGSAFVDYLESNLVVASEIKVNDLKAKLATITVADIDEMHVEHGFVESLQSFTSSTIEQKAETGYFYNLIAGNISVADLATHTATADEIVLISQDGNPSIAFKGSTQQFYDSDGNVRVQIGQDGNGDFNFVVTSADGQTALFDYDGITRDGIPANTIVNNMISDGTIQKSKLGFPIIDTNPDGTINITQIKDGSGGNFGVEYTTFTQNTSDAIDNLNDGIDEINSKKMYRVVVESDNGNIFKNGDVQCVLSCKVYSWDDDITDDINAANFTWTRKSKNSTSDTQWNANHSGGTKTLSITPSDVWGRSVFYCTVTLPDGSTATGG